MASLANIARLFFSSTSGTAHAPAEAGRSAAGRQYAVRALPNEDIYFFVKKVDNTRVVREVDPKQRVSCWKTIGGASTAAVLLICLLLPSVYNLLAGYQLNELHRERQRLLARKAALVVREAELLSPERLERLARMQHFIDPEPGKVIVLNPNAEGAVAALNVTGSK
jgi:hypothetical protein